LEEALLVPVLQVSQGQKVTSLTACLVDQSLRLDCHHDNTTSTPVQYEFSLTREKKKHVLYGTVGVPEHSYRSRTNFTNKYNIKVLYLANFTNKDEGTYTCELRLSGQPPMVSNQNVSVLRGEAKSPTRPKGLRELEWGRTVCKDIKQFLVGQRGGGPIPSPNCCLVPWDTSAVCVSGGRAAGQTGRAMC
jgi:syndecan 4